MDSMTKNTAKNTLLLYMLAIAKMIFPLITLPYLTRVLSKDSYGVVTYVKSCMTYMHILVDFGFLYSAVKDIVNCNGDKGKIGTLTGEVIVARILLGVFSILIAGVLCLAIPILRNYTLFTMLSAVGVAITALLLDYLFRGLEKMHVLTIIFVIMRGLTTILTFVFVKDDNDLLLIPILDIIGNLFAVVISLMFTRGFEIKIRCPKIKNVFTRLKESAVYFISSMATTAFTALLTLLIGIFITDLTVIAYWGVSTQLINAVVSMYDPIMKGIHPQMVKHKNIKFIGKVLCIFMPIVLCGCLVCYLVPEFVITLIAGEKYINAVPIFVGLIPVMFLSFPSMLMGWPSLGAIDKEKQVTLSTIISALFQIVVLGILILFDSFTMTAIIVLRSVTELVLLLIRGYFVLKNKNTFKEIGEKCGTKLKQN